jgi:hypothetical protein
MHDEAQRIAANIAKLPGLLQASNSMSLPIGYGCACQRRSTYRQ